MQVKLLAVLDFLEEKIDAVAKDKGLNGKDGAQGPKGDPGKDGSTGPAGKNGKDGKSGKDGAPGKDGEDGKQGVSVEDAKVDFDNHLVLLLSDGNEIDAGEVKVDGESGNSYNIAMSGNSAGATQTNGTSTDYTSRADVGHEVIICTNTNPITITLNPVHKDSDRVTVKRQNTGAVTVSGTIDGESSIILEPRYTAPQLVYTDEAGEWSLI